MRVEVEGFYLRRGFNFIFFGRFLQRVVSLLWDYFNVRKFDGFSSSL